MTDQKVQQVPQTTRECTKCNVSKKFEDFTKSKYGKFGVAPRCKDCSNEDLRMKTKKPRKISGEKKCLDCQLIKPVTEYSSNGRSQDGLQPYCKGCMAIRSRKSTSNLNGYLTQILRWSKKSAKDRNTPKNVMIHTITKQDLIDTYDRQNGLCAISNLEMTFVQEPNSKESGGIKYNPNHVRNISIDRIDSTKSYTPDNIQLVCSVINTMKSSFSSDDFVTMCKLVTYGNPEQLSPDELPQPQEVLGDELDE
jgi:hypothetical protein